MDARESAKIINNWAGRNEMFICIDSTAFMAFPDGRIKTVLQTMSIENTVCKISQMA